MLLSLEAGDCHQSPRLVRISRRRGKGRSLEMSTDREGKVPRKGSYVQCSEPGPGQALTQINMSLVIAVPVMLACSGSWGFSSGKRIKMTRTMCRTMPTLRGTRARKN